MTMVELRPRNLSQWDLRVYIAQERSGGWAPKHFGMPGDTTACQIAGSDPGDTYALSADREIWEEWYAVGWGCQVCAEVLHA